MTLDAFMSRSSLEAQEGQVEEGTTSAPSQVARCHEQPAPPHRCAATALAYLRHPQAGTASAWWQDASDWLERESAGFPSELRGPTTARSAPAACPPLDSGLAQHQMVPPRGLSKELCQSGNQGRVQHLVLPERLRAVASTGTQPSQDPEGERLASFLHFYVL
jgi:hypothetical protein